MKKAMFVIIAAAVFFASGCAVLFRGNIRSLPINSDPDGAEVLVNGQRMGRTPLNLRLPNNKSYTVEFKKAGYRNAVYSVNNQIGAGWIILDILAGFVPIIIDAATGAWYELEPDSVNAYLEKNN